MKLIKLYNAGEFANAIPDYYVGEADDGSLWMIHCVRGLVGRNVGNDDPFRGSRPYRGNYVLRRVPAYVERMYGIENPTGETFGVA